MILIPFANFDECANIFDSRIAKRQCINILRLLNHYKRFPTGDGPNIAAMWRDYQQALVEYGLIISKILGNKFHSYLAVFRTNEFIKMPQWLGWKPLHRSHQSMLMLVGLKYSIRLAVKQLICEGRFTSLSDFLNYYGYTKCFNQLQTWEFTDVKRRLIHDYRINLSKNIYEGLEERIDIHLAWPYNYYYCE